MTELNGVGLHSKAEIDTVFGTDRSGSADTCFGNVYMWDEHFNVNYAIYNGRLILLLTRREGRFFAYPVGTGDLRAAIGEMREISCREGIPFRMCGICEKHRTELEEMFPGAFRFTEDRDFSDYIYSIDKLSSYPGRELHAKRNFCNRFESEHKGNWSFEPLTGENIPDCIGLLELWDREAEGEKTEGIEHEHDAVIRGFKCYEELELEGGVLRVGNEPVGFTVGERISDDTFCVHFEKAHADIAGAYAMVCREFAKMIKAKHPEIHYVNREEDMGLASLRQSKLSYKPDRILIKYLAESVEP